MISTLDIHTTSVLARY